MARFWGGKRRDFRIRTIKRKKGLTKSSGYSIIGFAGSSRLERWPSGLWRWSWKPVIPQGTGGSNPSLSAIFYGEFHSVSVMQKYPRGRRGSPAKGVGCGKRREGSNPSFCAKKETLRDQSLFCYAKEIGREGIWTDRGWIRPQCGLRAGRTDERRARRTKSLLLRHSKYQLLIQRLVLFFYPMAA